MTSVGLTAAASCAAFRAKLTNPTETHFIDSQGGWLMAHQVPLHSPLRGLAKLSAMGTLAIHEAIVATPPDQRQQMPLILCVAETDRPGRMEGLDDRLFEMIRSEAGVGYSPHSLVVRQGRVGMAVALMKVRQLIESSAAPQVLVAATDTLLTWPTLSHYEEARRLLTPLNANGFMPGEAAGALLVGAPSGAPGEMLCTGIGFGRETAHINSEEPLRAEGLTQAIKGALADAGCGMHDMDFRITDLAGEQYYFKEATLALSRILRVRKEEFDIWHPAECTGEVGAASGATILAAAMAACSKRYAPGPHLLAHMSNDGGQRAALTLRYEEPR